MSRQYNPNRKRNNRSKSRAPKAHGRVVADAEATARAGGIPPEGVGLVAVLFDTPWSISDREFFATNPTRSHRVRRVFPHEPTNAAPGEYKYMLIRQVEPGKRIKKLLLQPIADNECLLHALFDLLGDDGVVNLQEWFDLARKYENISNA